MNSEREKADILFDYGLPLQFCCHLIQFYTLLFLRVATLRVFVVKKIMFLCTLATKWAKISSIYSKITKVGGMFKVFQLKNHTLCLGISA